MMYKNGKITNIQLAIIILGSIVGPSALILPNILAVKVGVDGWITILIAGILAIAITILIEKVVIKYPDKTLVGISRHLLPKPLAYITCIIFIVHCMFITAGSTRRLMDILGMFLLPKTPPQVISIAVAIMLIYMVRSGIEPMARFITMVIPVIAIPAILIAFLIIPDIDITNYLPSLQFNFKTMIKSLHVALLPMSGFELLYIYTFFVKENKSKVLKYNLLIVCFSTLTYISMFLICLGKFGVESLKYQIWPGLSLMKTVELPTAFIENIDGIVLSIWILTAFITTSSFLFSACFITSRLFKSKELKSFVIPNVVVMYVLANIPQNILEVHYYTDKVIQVTGTSVMIIIPILLFILSKIKEKKVPIKREGGNCGE